MTANIPGPVAPPKRILMGPGPSDIHPRVLLAMAAQTVGHLDPYFLQVMDETQTMLRQVFRTQNRLTLAVNHSLGQLPSPIEVPAFVVRQCWHERFHGDAANQWLRVLVAELFGEGGG